MFFSFKLHDDKIKKIEDTRAMERRESWFWKVSPNISCIHSYSREPLSIERGRFPDLLLAMLLCIAIEIVNDYN